MSARLRWVMRTELGDEGFGPHHRTQPGKANGVCEYGIAQGAGRLRLSGLERR